MDKEKILAMSREENKNMDEREKLVNDKSGIVGLMCMSVMCIILFSYKAFVLGENAYDLLALYASALMGTNFYQYKQLKKKSYLICGCVWMCLDVLRRGLAHPDHQSGVSAWTTDSY